MFQSNSKVYVQVDDKNRIVACAGGYTTPTDLTGWILIDEGVGDKCNLCQTHYFDGGIKTARDIPHYKLVDGAPMLRSEEELAAELAEIQAVSIEAVKAAKIAESKTQLANYLEAHPITYTDGKQYSVTAEKQSLLTSALARNQIATAAGMQTALKWNATGEECTVWEYADLAALALAIAAYVEPLVSQQQAAEVAINACSTVAEVEAIVIAYGL